MKRMYYMLLMVCTICAFAACSDDDGKNEDPLPQNPVTDYSLPVQGEIGGDVTIKGKGYTAESKIFLKDAQGEKEMTVKTHSSVDLVFTVAPTLTAGTYSVMLHQAGGSWELGTIALVAANPVKDFEIAEASVKPGETVHIKGTGWADDCQIYLQDAAAVRTDIEKIQKTETGIQFTMPAVAAGTYTVMLKQDGDWSLGNIEVVADDVKRLRKIEYSDTDGDRSVYELFYNAEGKIDSVYRTNYDVMKIGWKISYTENQITVAITGTNGWGPADETIVFNLENGVLKSSTSTSSEYGTETSTWTMNAKGYLESLTVGENDNVTYAYDAEDNLITSDNPGNFFNVGFAYEANGKVENNLGGVDGMAIIFSPFDYPDFMARLLGIAGKIPAWLPSGITEDSAWGAYTINYKKSGDLVSEIDLIDDTDYHTTYTLSYK